MGIPLAALSIRQQPQPDLLGEVGKIQQIQQGLNELATQKIQLENARQAQLEQTTIKDLYRQNNGDLEKTVMAAAQSGKVSPATLNSLQAANIKMKTDLASQQESALKNTLSTGNLFAG